MPTSVSNPVPAVVIRRCMMPVRWRRAPLPVRLTGVALRPRSRTWRSRRRRRRYPRMGRKLHRCDLASCATTAALLAATLPSHFAGGGKVPTGPYCTCCCCCCCCRSFLLLLLTLVPAAVAVARSCCRCCCRSYLLVSLAPAGVTRACSCSSPPVPPPPDSPDEGVIPPYSLLLYVG